MCEMTGEELAHRIVLAWKVVKTVKKSKQFYSPYQYKRVGWQHFPYSYTKRKPNRTSLPGFHAYADKEAAEHAASYYVGLSSKLEVKRVVLMDPEAIEVGRIGLSDIYIGRIMIFV